jgi:hypothetical protein
MYDATGLATTVAVLADMAPVGADSPHYYCDSNGGDHCLWKDQNLQGLIGSMYSYNAHFGNNVWSDGSTNFGDSASSAINNGNYCWGAAIFANGNYSGDSIFQATKSTLTWLGSMDDRGSSNYWYC